MSHSTMLRLNLSFEHQEKLSSYARTLALQCASKVRIVHRGVRVIVSDRKTERGSGSNVRAKGCHLKGKTKEGIVFLEKSAVATVYILYNDYIVMTCVENRLNDTIVKLDFIHLPFLLLVSAAHLGALFSVDEPPRNLCDNDYAHCLL